MKTAIIGIGNPLLGDDNIGNAIIDELKDLENENTILIKAETNPENFIEVIKKFNPNRIYFIDAVNFNGKIGEVNIFEINDILNESISTHEISIKIFKSIFPNKDIFIIGIKPESIEYKEKLSKNLNTKFLAKRIKLMIS